MVDISNVVNVSTAQAPRGLSAYNVNVVVYFTTELPLESWGDDQYRSFTLANPIATEFGSNSVTFNDSVFIFAQKPNLLAGNGRLLIVPLQESETIVEAYQRIVPLVYFGGFMTNKVMEDAEIISTAQFNETQKSIFLVGKDSLDALTASTGVFAQIAAMGANRTKMILYTTSEDACRQCVCAYMGRAFSTNFSAQNSTITMNLKDLINVLPDESISQTTYDRCATLGVDLYTDYNGLPKVVSNGNPLYFDDVYNRLWFELSQLVALFNTIGTTATKIPQTEVGVNKLKNAARQICELGVYNGFLAPGTWNGTDTFGNQDDFYRNIEDFGFYIYSLPVSEQLQAEREERVAPVLQIACKQAGAVHKINLILSFEA